MTTAPVRLDRLQHGLCASVLHALPAAAVVWAPSEYPRGSGLLVAIRIIAGPHFAAQGGEAVRMVTLPTAATVRVLDATAGRGVGLRASGLAWEYVIQAGDGVEDVRDGLLASIGEAPPIDAVFEPNDTDEIEIVATALGDLYGLAVRGSAPGLIELETTTAAACKAQIGEVTTTIEIQAYSSSRYARSGATAAVTRWLSTLRLPSSRAILGAAGLSIVEGSPRVVNLDTLSGPGWESRAAVSLSVSQLSIAAELVDTIETIAFDLDARTPDGTAVPLTVEIP